MLDANTMSTAVRAKAAALYAGEGLAPMVRASTTPLRVLALRWGADFVYTEELIDRSLVGTERVVNKKLGTIDYVKNTATLSKKSVRKLQGAPALILRTDPAVERGRLILQLGTGEPEHAVAAALHVYQDVDAIDVNMGCPKKFSVSGGMGSALLSDRARAYSIIRSLSEAMTPLGLPVSAKIRLLCDVDSTLEFITGLVGAGCSAVAIHGRRVGDESVHPARWECLREVVTLAKIKFPKLPILINGDFYTRQEFVDFMDSTGANGVLLARPALYNTSIFRKPTDIGENWNSSSCWGYDSKLLLDKAAVVQDYIKLSVRYGIHYKNTKYVVCEFLSNRRTPIPRTPYLPQNFPAGQTVGKTCACHSLHELCHVWGVDYAAAVLTVPAAAVAATNIDDVLSDELAQQAGEHKYLDSYFIGGTTEQVANQSTTATGAITTTKEEVEEEAQSKATKRMRVEELSSSGEQ
jgi:tRNA-dihydrouridine synthase 2